MTRRAAARAPRPAPCEPRGDLTRLVVPEGRCATGAHELRCEACGAPLRKRWNTPGTDWDVVDHTGRHQVSDAPPAYTADPARWWANLANANAARYSLLSAQVSLGGRMPWDHTHRLAPCPDDGTHTPLGVPTCHDRPMRLLRDAWECRETGTRHPFTAEAAA